ncbi:MAG: 16S rRNA (uracil(1498)-N(3))-methyltransferase [Chitinophagaceae bacterium]|nr:MAG: 16S rRNA (uracil(1498)-N(3))-methyltransferase [Chitinophagaceae bacterium]
MALPFFYKKDILPTDTIVVLDEDTSKHVVQVLRMQNGEKIKLTDGKGNIFTCQITDNHRKKCVVTIIEKSQIKNLKSKICVAVSPVKNNSRFEWFLEKATEIGVSEIVPLICERTEKQQLKTERLNGILISAMLQSQQAWLPVLQEAKKYAAYVQQANADAALQKFIAHCEEDKKVELSTIALTNNTTILIGPEGDFTHKEIELALQSGFEPVSLGQTRLRTETAGMFAAVLLNR